MQCVMQCVMQLDMLRGVRRSSVGRDVLFAAGIVTLLSGVC